MRVTTGALTVIASTIELNLGDGIVVDSAASASLTDTRIVGNESTGIRANGGLTALRAVFGENTEHGVLVETTQPVSLVDSIFRGNGLTGATVLRASHGDGFTISGTQSVISGNAGHGVVLGDASAQSGVVIATVAEAQIFDNEIGIRVQQKDAAAAATWSAILSNNIFNNRSSGLYVSTSYQKYSEELSDRRTIAGNDVHHNAVIGACTAASGAQQSASQIVFDGPIASSDPSFADEAGPDLDYPDDRACFFTVGGARILTEAECVSMNDPNPVYEPVNGGVVRHCVWNGYQCRVAWEAGGKESSSFCDSTPNRIFNYINHPVMPPTTQRGVAALHGAVVRARRNTWGAGGSDDAVATDSGFGSLVDAENPCPGTITSCVYEDASVTDPDP